MKDPEDWRGFLDEWKKEISRPGLVPGCVYIIQLWDTDIYKIGISTDPQRRLKQIQSKSPIPIKLIRYWWGHDYKYFEKQLHYVLRQHRIKGEWFRLSTSILLQLTELYPLDMHEVIQQIDVPGVPDLINKLRSN